MTPMGPDPKVEELSPVKRGSHDPILSSFPRSLLADAAMLKRHLLYPAGGIRIVQSEKGSPHNPPALQRLSQNPLPVL